MMAKKAPEIQDYQYGFHGKCATLAWKALEQGIKQAEQE